MAQVKRYTYSSQVIERRLVKVGYQVEYNWVDKDKGHYNVVTVYGPLFPRGKEFAAPKQAWEEVRKYTMK